MSILSLVGIDTHFRRERKSLAHCAVYKMGPQWAIAELGLWNFEVSWGEPMQLGLFARRLAVWGALLAANATALLFDWHHLID